MSLAPRRPNQATAGKARTVSGSAPLASPSAGNLSQCVAAGWERLVQAPPGPAVRRGQRLDADQDMVRAYLDVLRPRAGGLRVRWFTAGVGGVPQRPQSDAWPRALGPAGGSAGLRRGALRTPVLAPSVILLRRIDKRAISLAAVVLANLGQVTGDLAAGALVVISDTRIRTRRLPMKPAD